MNKTLIIIGIVLFVGFLIFKFGLKSAQSDLKHIEAMEAYKIKIFILNRTTLS